MIEVPLGRPQIKYFEEGDQWVPRAQVLRCHVEDDEEGKLVVYVDDQKSDLHNSDGCSRPMRDGACESTLSMMTQWQKSPPWKLKIRKTSVVPC